MRLPILQLSCRLLLFFFGGGGHYITHVCQSPLQPRFGFLRLLAFPKAKIAFEREEICECDGHTVHKLRQRVLTADWLAQCESDCSRMTSKASSEWLPSYIKATRPILQIFKVAGYFPNGPRLGTIQLSKIKSQSLLYRSWNCIFALSTDTQFYSRERKKAGRIF